MNSENENVLPVTRTKAQAKESYDKLSKFYDQIAGVFEKKYMNKALNLLDIKEGEIVLEIGFGTGHALKQIAELTGDKGKVYGIDLSPAMLKISKHRLEKAGLVDKVELKCGDALEMPYDENKFSAVFMSFTLELFDNPEIPKILGQIKNILKPGGRLGIVSLSKDYDHSIFIRMYEWMHKKFPRYADCRPIYVERSVKEAGFIIKKTEKVTLFGLPAEIILCLKPS